MLIGARLRCGARCTNFAKRECYQSIDAQLSIPSDEVIWCARKQSDRLNGRLAGGCGAWTFRFSMTTINTRPCGSQISNHDRSLAGKIK